MYFNVYYTKTLFNGEYIRHIIGNYHGFFPDICYDECECHRHCYQKFAY